MGDLVVGDPHNFGRTVKFTRDGRVYKPRSIFWEKLFLDRNIFRDEIDLIFKSNDQISPFSAVPYLNIEDRVTEGHVERLYCHEAQSINIDDARAIGSTCAIIAFLGLNDIHKDNLIIGKKDNKFIFAPIDIECIFDKTFLLSQTLLVPKRKLNDEMCGLADIIHSKVEASNEALAAICQEFVSSLLLLYSNRKRVGRVLSQIITENSDRKKIRIIPRETIAYAKFLQENDLISNGTPEEFEQLERGDIPYFFRYIDSDKLYFYSSSNLQNVSIVSEAFYSNFELPMSMHSLNEIPFKHLIQFGTLQLADSLVKHKPVNTHFKFASTSIFKATDNRVFLNWNDQIKLKTEHE